MENFERDKIIFEAKCECSKNRDSIFTFNCEDCNSEVKIRVAVLSKKENILLCRKCSIAYTKNNWSDEKKKEVLNKRVNTCMDKYGLTNGGGSEKSKEKARNTWIQNSGSLEEAFRLRRIKIEKTLLEHYGVDCPMKDKSVVDNFRKSMIEKYGSIEEAYKDRIITIQKTMMEKYGVKTNLQLEENKEKSKKTLLRNYGVDHPMKSEKIKRGMIERNGTLGCTGVGYTFNNIRFDSSYELAYYIWLIDNNIEFTYHPNKEHILEYEGEDNKMHLYVPDFLVEGKLIEIKGGFAFNKQGEPFDHYSKTFWWKKYNFLIENKVKIIKDEDMIPIFEYIKNKYGKNFIKSCKRKYSKKETLVQGVSV